jgi:hypothetical protein
MPNHVTNILIISGPEELVTKIKSEIAGVYDDSDEERLIDFNKIMPAPPSLNITSGTTTDYGLAILKYRAGDTKEIMRILAYPWGAKYRDADDLIEHLIADGRANLEEAQMALDNIRDYGYPDWKDWSINNWGTKWNAYSHSSREDGAIKFETAWSTPYPVMEALSRKYPEAVIKVRYADEDFGHNCGEYTFQGGDLVEETTPEGGSDEAYELAADIQDDPNWFIDRLLYIEAETVDELEDYEINSIRYAYDKGVLDEFPKVVLEVMEQMAVEDENYEFAERIKNTIAVNEE